MERDTKKFIELEEKLKKMAWYELFLDKEGHLLFHDRYKKFIIPTKSKLARRGFLMNTPQPLYYPKYGATTVTPTGERVMEYERYQPESTFKAGKGKSIVYTKKTTSRGRVRTTDTYFDPAKAPSSRTVTKYLNIHKLVGWLATGSLTGDFITHDMEMPNPYERQDSSGKRTVLWDSKPAGERYKVLMEAAIELVHIVSDIEKNTKDVNIVSIRVPRSNKPRHMRAILWKSMATHFRIRYKGLRYCITWDALKYIADHHPCAVPRHNQFTSSEMETYVPPILVSDTTVLEVPVKRMFGLTYFCRKYNVDSACWEHSGYYRWFKSTIQTHDWKKHVLRSDVFRDSPLKQEEIGSLIYSQRLGFEDYVQQVKDAIAEQYAPQTFEYDTLNSYLTQIKEAHFVERAAYRCVSPDSLYALGKWLNVPFYNKAYILDPLAEKHIGKTFGDAVGAPRQAKKPKPKKQLHPEVVKNPLTPARMAELNSQKDFIRNINEMYYMYPQVNTAKLEACMAKDDNLIYTLFDEPVELVEQYGADDIPGEIASQIMLIEDYVKTDFSL